MKHEKSTGRDVRNDIDPSLRKLRDFAMKPGNDAIGIFLVKLATILDGVPPGREIIGVVSQLIAAKIDHDTDTLDESTLTHVNMILVNSPSAFEGVTTLITDCLAAREDLSRELDRQRGPIQ